MTLRIRSVIVAGFVATLVAVLVRISMPWLAPLGQNTPYTEMFVFQLASGFFFSLFGVALILLGRSAQKRRRIINLRFIRWFNDVYEYRGQTAVVIGKLVEISGYLWCGMMVLGLLIGGLLHLVRPRGGDMTARAPQETKATFKSAATMAEEQEAAKREFDAVRRRHEEIRKRIEEDHQRRWGSTPRSVMRAPTLPQMPPPPKESETAPPAAATKPMRQWKSANGKYTIVASLDEQTETEAVLRQADGTVVRVEISKLCAVDQEWLARQK